MVVGRGERQHLGDAEVGERLGRGALELGRVVHRADADDRPLPLHEARDGVHRADRAGVGEGDRRPGEVVGTELAAARLLHQVLVGGPELLEVERLGVLDRRDEELAGAVRLRQVDREAEADVLGPVDGRLAVDLRVARVHLRHLGERLDDRVPDEVRERDLPAAGAGEVVVDDDPVVPQQLRRHRAHARGGRHAERGLHVLHDAGGRTAQLRGPGVGKGDAALRRDLTDVDRRRGLRDRGRKVGAHVVLGGELAARVSVRRGGDGAGRGGRCRGGGGCGRRTRRWRRTCGRRRRGCRGRGPSRRGGLVRGRGAGEEGLPLGRHGGGIGEPLLAHLVDEPLVGTERRRSG